MRSKKFEGSSCPSQIKCYEVFGTSHIYLVKQELSFYARYLRGSVCVCAWEGGKGREANKECRYRNLLMQLF